jgi:hypothetical protein
MLVIFVCSAARLEVMVLLRLLTAACVACGPPDALASSATTLPLAVTNSANAPILRKMVVHHYRRPRLPDGPKSVRLS